MISHHFIEIALVICFASLAAIAFDKIKLQPMIGYVLAGILIGPNVFEIIGNEKEIALMAEIGVILLLFVLGIELPLSTFKKNYKISVPITFALIVLSMVLTFCIGLFAELNWQKILVYGFIISLSSTAVAVKLLEDIDPEKSQVAQTVVGILIVQDLLFVPMIIIINGLGSEAGVDWMFLPKVVIACALLVGLILYLGRKEKIHLLFEETVEKHQDLIPVAALTWCFVGAGLSEYFGLSPAYGAFLAGLIIGNSHSKYVVLPKIMPMQSVFLMVFFLSIGMLIDFEVIRDNWGLILSLLFSVMVLKTLVSVLLLKAFLKTGKKHRRLLGALTISQIGEFSFILAATALLSGVFSDDNYKVIVAVIALSLAISPIWTQLFKNPVFIRRIRFLV